MAAYLHLFASWDLICTICILHGFSAYSMVLCIIFPPFWVFAFSCIPFCCKFTLFSLQKHTSSSAHLLYCPTYNMPKVLNPTVLIKELGGTQLWSYVSETKHLVCKLCSFSAKILKKNMESLWQKNNVRLYIEGEKIA